MHSLANSPAVSFEAANATKFLFCCVRHGLEWSDFKKPEIPNFSPLFDFQRLSHKMSPSYGLLHGWGFVFISPDSAVRPENPQTAACCSCVPFSANWASHSCTCALRSAICFSTSPVSLASRSFCTRMSTLVPNRYASLTRFSAGGSVRPRFHTPEGQPPSLPTKMPRLGFHPQPEPKFSLLRNQE